MLSSITPTSKVIITPLAPVFSAMFKGAIPMSLHLFQDRLETPILVQAICIDPLTKIQRPSRRGPWGTDVAGKIGFRGKCGNSSNFPKSFPGSPRLNKEWSLG